MKFFLALFFAATAAHAAPVTQTCSLESGKTGLHTIENATGELGDNEDGSPVRLRGYLVVANCQSREVSAFFTVPADLAGLGRLLGGRRSGTRVDLTIDTHEPGMEGREYALVTRLAMEGGALTTEGHLLQDPYRVLR